MGHEGDCLCSFLFLFLDLGITRITGMGEEEYWDSIGSFYTRGLSCFFSPHSCQCFAGFMPWDFFFSFFGVFRRECFRRIEHDLTNLCLWKIPYTLTVRFTSVALSCGWCCWLSIDWVTQQLRAPVELLLEGLRASKWFLHICNYFGVKCAVPLTHCNVIVTFGPTRKLNIKSRVSSGQGTITWPQAPLSPPTNPIVHTTRGELGLSSANRSASRNSTLHRKKPSLPIRESPRSSFNHRSNHHRQNEYVSVSLSANLESQREKRIFNLLRGATFSILLCCFFFLLLTHLAV